jgi:hypothetical protein
MRELAESVAKNTVDKLKDYLSSEGPGGKQVIGAFIEEFEKLSERSPADDPTNIKNHMSFVLNHVKETWDESLSITEQGELSIGICKDEIIGFDIDRAKLKHNPSPVVWTVFLIRGIAGRYAFVNPDTYFKKKGAPMPPQYAGGFLISKRAWIREGWDKAVGPFEAYEHPASGAPPIPFFDNVIRKIDLESLVSSVLASIEAEGQ